MMRAPEVSYVRQTNISGRQAQALSLSHRSACALALATYTLDVSQWIRGVQVPPLRGNDVEA
jgi:hypothetical protein